ncbi:MAG: hypothetical protein FWG66_07395 [Spirochaetes bacterium]|nr:hypothetical protein [Spirochaetota bacterium]
MAKKILLGLVMAAFVVGGAFAQNPITFGVGTFFTSDFGGGFEHSITDDADLTTTTIIRSPNSGFGGLVFVDALFASMSVGFFTTSGAWERTLSVDDGTDVLEERWDGNTNLTGLKISLMGKLPIAISESVTIFPMIGFSYRAVLAASTLWIELDDDREEVDREHQLHANPGDFSALWFRFGLGMDFNVSERTFLRGTFTYGMRFRNDFERHAIGDGASGRIGHGVDVMLGLGFR